MLLVVKRQCVTPGTENHCIERKIIVCIEFAFWHGSECKLAHWHYCRLATDQVPLFRRSLLIGAELLEAGSVRAGHCCCKTIRQWQESSYVTHEMMLFRPKLFEQTATSILWPKTEWFNQCCHSVKLRQTTQLCKARLHTKMPWPWPYTVCTTEFLHSTVHTDVLYSCC